LQFNKEGSWFFEALVLGLIQPGIPELCLTWFVILQRGSWFFEELGYHFLQPGIPEICLTCLQFLKR
jgi:hypothetical protein